MRKIIIFKNISLEDCSFLKPFLAGQNIGDFTFTNLFMWRYQREIAFCEMGGFVVVRIIFPNKKPFFSFPLGCGDATSVIKNMLNLYGEDLEFRSLTKEQKELLERDFIGVFSIELNADRSDYVYLVSELINLSGRKFHKKKNHLNQFLKQNPNFVYENFNEQNLPKIKQVQERWQKGRDDEALYFEGLGILDVLDNFTHLQKYFDLRGGAILLEDEVVGFSFGEVLNKQFCLIHIEKADFATPGSYQIINQQFLVNEFSHLEFVNREEDLGIPGLRRAKQSYHPVFLLEKFEAKVQR